MDPKLVTNAEAHDLARRRGIPARCALCGTPEGDFVDKGDTDATLICVKNCLRPLAQAAGYLDGPQSDALREQAKSDAGRVAELEGALHAERLDAHVVAKAKRYSALLQEMAGLSMELAPHATGAGDEPSWSGFSSETFE
jgi:hypothetical protein